MSGAIDPARCPLCGAANACARVADPDSKECWCVSQVIPAELLARVPASAVGCACICRNCVERANVSENPGRSGDE